MNKIEGAVPQVVPGSPLFQPELFPSDAFSTTDVGTSAPILTLNSPWELSLAGLLSGLKMKSLALPVAAETSHTIADTDRYIVYRVTTGSVSDFTLNLPTAADNAGKYIVVVKVDSGTTDAIIDGEGAEVLFNGEVSYATLELRLQGDTAVLFCDGTQWWKLNLPALHKVSNPGTDWLGEKTAGWTADSFSSGFEVDFSGVVPAGTKAVRINVANGTAAGYIYYRKSGDTNISDTPHNDLEWSHRLLYISTVPASNQVVIWLSSDYKAQFAVTSTSQDLYISHPMEYLL